MPGYRLEWLQITDPKVIATSGSDRHPILRTGAANDSVDGARLQVSDAELLRADEYEVDYHVRVSATLASGEKCWVYVDAAPGPQALVAEDCTLPGLVGAVRALPYGRPSDRRGHDPGTARHVLNQAPISHR